MNRQAFTLIEVLVVVSIISLIASVVLVSVNKARTKGVNAKFIQEVKSLQLGMTSWFLDHGSVPTCYGQPGCAMNDHTSLTGLESVLAPLINGGYISRIPHYPGWAPQNSKVYIYYEPPLNGGTYIAKVICGTQSYSNWNPEESRQQGSFWFVNNTGVPFEGIYDQYTLCTTRAPNAGCVTYDNPGGICIDAIGI